MMRSLCLVFALALPITVWAQGAQVSFGSGQQDTSAPVEVSADRLDVDQDAGLAIYTGNVVIGQNAMRLAAPLVRVIYSETEGRIQRMEARGGVTLVNGDEAAEGAEADYDLIAGTILMRGDVLLARGGNAIVSEEMLVDLETGTAEMRGRVRSVLEQGGE